MDGRHFLNVHYNSPVCFDCSVEFFTSFPTSFSQAVPEVSLPSCVLLSSAFPDAFALLPFHSLQSSVPVEQGAWSDNGALGWASVGSKYNPVQISWLQKLLKTIREQALGMSYAARVSSFPKGSSTGAWSLISRVEAVAIQTQSGWVASSDLGRKSPGGRGQKQGWSKLIRLWGSKVFIVSPEITML